MPRIIILITCICTMSCGSYEPINIEAKYQSLIDTNCLQKSNFVLLYSDTSEIPYPFKEIGIITSSSSLKSHSETGHYYSTVPMVSFMQYGAWCNCANGIIKIKKAPNSYSGIAVHLYTSDLNKYTDTSFVTHVQNEINSRATYEKRAEERKVSTRKLIQGTVTLVLAGIIVSLNQDE